jgi:hypothetical protein
MSYIVFMDYGSHGAGKGSSPRPVNMETYGKNYEAIFNSKKKKKTKKLKK